MDRLSRIFKEASLRAVIYSKKNLDLRLDFSEESLFLVDEILEMFHKAKNESHLNSDNIIDISMMFGGYLGEVISKNIGGEWEESELKEIFIDINGFKVLPINIIYKRVNFGEKATVIGWYEKFKKKI
ncbi:hypothetical protein [Clostridium chrysemydis]|uniref:hypothetical protein n=1 Tax=Clostridium chrysemydis TaxID=2665504 RepID=UPI0018842540|nr:hypothetical protein [Clostridium chrysemydis]